MAAARSLLVFPSLLGPRRSLIRQHKMAFSGTAVRPSADSPAPAAMACWVWLRARGVIRELLKVAAAVPVFVLLSGTLAMARPTNQEMRNLKRAHKQQWKSLKQQERAQKDALDRHPQTPESRKRFKQDMKEQRRLVKQEQKSEIRGLKESQHAAKHQTSGAKHTEAQVRREVP